MAFVCTLSSQGSLLPAIATFPSLTSLVYPIGYDDRDGRAYQLFIGFGTAPGGIVEYSFCIICTYRDGVAHDIWDSQVVANIIPRGDRELIMALLVDATARLIQSTNFPEITMHTFARGLPPKALAKYRYIAQLFRNAGYSVRTKERRGQHIWWFERETEAPRVKRGSARRRQR